MRKYYPALVAITAVLFFNACGKKPDDDQRVVETITITTTSISAITYNAATSGGAITYTLSVNSRGVCWDTLVNPTTSDSKTIDGAGTGSYSSALTGLRVGKTYYVRAYAMTNAGIAYGNEVTFTTPVPPPIPQPVVITGSVSNVNFVSAVAGGTVNSPVYGVQERGVCWALHTNPDIINDTKSVQGTGEGTFTCPVGMAFPLFHGFNYYIRAYAVTSIGTFYGENVQFSTPLNTSAGALQYPFVSSTNIAQGVHSAARQNDGKFIITGQITGINGISMPGIARLNADGTHDPSFNAGNSYAGVEFNVVCLQPDGKILRGGDFTSFGGSPATSIVRLNADGSRDATFQYTNSNLHYVKDIVLQPDGKILVGANAVAGLFRLNADGSADASFVPVFRTIFDIELQPDGKLVVAGTTLSAKCVDRLNSNGSQDASFTLGFVQSPGQSCVQVKLQPDGKILYQDVVKGIGRLNSNGSIDNTFNPGTGILPGNGIINTIDLQANGKIVIGGIFTSFDGHPAVNCQRLNTDGSFDGGFSTGNTIQHEVSKLICLPDSKIFFTGRYSIFLSRNSTHFYVGQLLGN
jgi:uncharacterized delta-60 repeat protein